MRTGSRGPVVASHSSARALCGHPRNLPDDLIRAIADRGGLVMANAFPAFLDDDACRANLERMERLGPRHEVLEEAYADAPTLWAEARERLIAGHPQPAVPRARYVDHIVHLVEVAGVEGVGLGTDFDGIPETPVGLEGPHRFPELLDDLLARGLDERAVDLVAGGNFVRVWRRVGGQALSKTLGP